ncbi:MAG: hypothetical protein COA79_19110 [Planctomycetota bacterium]|nr:MAG: hypothetical protein COA79_19110 [Planctomycetota bacterium]
MALLNIKDKVAIEEFKGILKKGDNQKALPLAISFAYKLKLVEFKPHLKNFMTRNTKTIKIR